MALCYGLSWFLPPGHRCGVCSQPVWSLHCGRAAHLFALCVNIGIKPMLNVIFVRPEAVQTGHRVANHQNHQYPLQAVIMIGNCAWEMPFMYCLRMIIMHVFIHHTWSLLVKNEHLHDLSSHISKFDLVPRIARKDKSPFIKKCIWKVHTLIYG